MSWAAKKLDEIADFHLGKMLDEKKNKGDPLPYLANVNVRWGEFELSDSPGAQAGTWVPANPE